MIPMRVYLHGFMSYREATELRFDGAPLWVLAGRNGSGKSAIFDAITYALYGQHRGGAQNARTLINHASDGLNVEFDFSIGPDAYRVKRTLSRKGATTCQAIHLGGPNGPGAAGEPQPISETETKSGFDQWVTGIIGLNFQIFTTSVLLQQGRSDALLESEPKARHELLSKIVDLSAYERLFDRADAEHKSARVRVDACKMHLDRIAPVDAEDIARVDAEIAEAREDLVEARSKTDRFTELKLHAARWEDLCAARDALDRAIAEASDLTTSADRIEDARSHLAELRAEQKALRDRRDALQEALGDLEPKIRDLDHLDDRRRELTDLDRKAAAYPSDLDERRAALDRDATRFAEAHTALPWLQAFAKARAAALTAAASLLDAEARATGLDQELSAAVDARDRLSRRLEKAVAEAESAIREAAESRTLAREMARRLERFSQVAGAAECLYCGQPLTAEHLEAERARLEGEIEAATRRSTEATERERIAVGERDDLEREAKQAESRVKRLDDDRHEALRTAESARERREAAREQAKPARTHLPDAYASRVRWVETDDPSAYPAATDLAEIADLADRAASAAREVKQCDEQVKARDLLFKLREPVQNEVDRLTASYPDGERLRDEYDRGRREAAGMKERLATLDVDIADAESALVKLEADLARIAEIDQQRKELGRIVREIDMIPEQARRALADITTDERAARAQFEAVDARLRDAEQARRQIDDQRQQRIEVEAQFLAASREEHLYKELAKLLGRDRLQRHLLQMAELAIVANANDVLDRISSGTLRLELKQSEAASGKAGLKALDLVAYHTETGAKAVPVAFLSGSQRFRVAVSLALAIGRYAGQGTRRIESVIIDEGFGSLDREGRREMIDELHALKTALDCVILVSHQEEFSDSFSNRYLVELVDGASRVALDAGAVAATSRS